MQSKESEYYYIFVSRTLYVRMNKQVLLLAGRALEHDSSSLNSIPFCSPMESHLK